MNRLSARTVWTPPDPVRDRPIMGALIGQRGTLIIETGASPSHANEFLHGLADLNAPTPRFAALTHWHWDHVFGTATMALPTLGHVETRRRVQEMARLDWRDTALNNRVLAGLETAFIADHMKMEMSNIERGQLVITPPDITFTERMEVDLGDLTARIIHVGGDHSPDSSVIFSPEERVAFLGDCFYAGFIGASDSFYTPRRVLPLIDTLTALEADYFVLSHHPEPMPRAEFLNWARQLRITAEWVEQYGPDREKLLGDLPVALGQPLNGDNLEDLECLLRGLQADVE